MFQIVRLLARDAQEVFDRILHKLDKELQKIRYELSQVPRGKAIELLSLKWGCFIASARNELASIQQREGRSS